MTIKLRDRRSLRWKTEEEKTEDWKTEDWNKKRHARSKGSALVLQRSDLLSWSAAVFCLLHNSIAGVARRRTVRSERGKWMVTRVPR